MADAPAEGLAIYNTTVKCLQWFDGGFWIDACGEAPEATPNSNLNVANVTYQGQSVINTQGIGYNAEEVPAASTITVDLTNSSVDPQNYGLIATDPATGLTYSATGIIASSTTISVVLNHNTPTIASDFFGTITMPLNGASNTINLEPRIDVKSIPASATEVKDISFGSQIWMDRNLGARRVATSETDVLSFGNYYQWGRPADGHEIFVHDGSNLTNGRGLTDTTTTTSTTDTPPNSLFIVGSSDWQQPSVGNNRWEAANQGPCPTGYRVPSTQDWANAISFGSWSNAQDVYNSPLKLPFAGRRRGNQGDYLSYGAGLSLWTSNDFKISNQGNVFLAGSSISVGNFVHDKKSNGRNVRCIKN